MRPHLFVLLATLAHTASFDACAQDAPPLTVETTDPGAAQRVLGALSDGTSELQLPERADGEHWVLSLDGERQIDIALAAGDLDLRITANPPQLMEMFADEVAMGERRARGLLGMTYASIGIDFEDVAPMVRAMFDFPRQVRSFHLDIVRGPEGAIRATTTLEPVASSWFAEFVEAIGPSSRKITPLPNQDSVLHARASIDLLALAPKIQPLLQPFATSWATSEDERARSLEWFRRSFQTFAGTFDFRLGATGMRAMRVIAGLTDPESYLELIRDPEFRAYQKRTSEAGGQATVTFDEETTAHRGVSFQQITIEIENPAMINPMMDDEQKIVTLFGVCGENLATTGFGVEDAHEIVDHLLDAETTPVDLAPGRLVEARIRLAELVAMLAGQFTQDQESADVSEQLDVHISKSDNQLQVELLFQ